MRLKPSVVLCFRLLDSAAACLKVQLLTYLERGSLYRYIKKTAYPGNWINFCTQELGVALQTVNKYIQFFELVGTYPRIIICKIPFKTIMFCRNEVTDMLRIDNNLALRFAAPLPEIQITGNIFFEQECLPTNDSMATVGRKPHGDEWNAGWQISDEILDTMTL